MTRSSFLVVALSLVGCGGSRAAKSPCAALVACCDSQLPSAYAASCDALAKSTDESACTQALSEIQAASYCASVSSSNGPSESSSHPCNQYLSCLLATEPDAYAGALQLYGSGSACWANSAQTAGCNQACDSAFAEIATSCTCTGDSCTSCNAPTTGTYYPSGQATGTCGVDTGSIQIVSIAADRTASIIVDAGGQELPFTGTLACSGPSMFTASGSAAGSSGGTCVENLALTLTPAGTSGSFLATITDDVSAECAQFGQPSSCSESVTVQR